MRKIKKMVLGMALAIGVFAGSVGSCYAATSSITVDITADRAYGKFVYGEAGHQLKVIVFYQEKDLSSGYTYNRSISNVQNGNVTEVVAVRNSPAGFKYTWGYASGYVDGSYVCSSAEVSVK